MPPEPLPWDRKDYFEKRKHSERSSDASFLAGVAGGGGGGATSRWRDATPYHHGPRDYRSEDSRRFGQGCNNGKQGGYQVLVEESNGYGCMPSRSSGEDESFNGRPSPASSSRSRGYGTNGYSYYNRENRGSFCQRDYYWRGDRLQEQQSHHHPWEPPTVRQQPYTAHDEGGSRASVDQSHRDHMIGNSDGVGVEGRRYDVKDHSLGSMTWKPMKWSRSGGISARYSVGVLKMDLEESGPEKVTQLMSESPREGVEVKVLDALMESPRPPLSDEASNPKKKQRLGWGQGLAKREKKLEGPPEETSKGSSVAQSLLEGSPKVSECASPATAVLATCSSSPGMEDKSFAKASNNEQEAVNSVNSVQHVVDNFSEKFSSILEKLDHKSNESINSLIHDLLQHEDASSGDSSYIRNSAMRKLLLLKDGVSKELEKAESEIDMLEIEIKSLYPETGNCVLHPIECKSSQTEMALRTSGEPAIHVTTNLPSNSAPNDLLSSAVDPVAETSCGDSLAECQKVVKVEDIDSPGTVTSKVAKGTSEELDNSIVSTRQGAPCPPNRKIPAVKCDPGGGDLTLVPTAEIIDYTRKLMSDSHIKLHRSSLKMPALILDEKERKQSRFLSNNGLVDDPCLEKAKSTINPWTPEEEEVFMEMLATFGKDFSKIASCLSHKTTADCIEFYYKNQKSESFREVKKKLKFRKQMQTTNTYLIASGKILNRDSTACSRDLLGAASVAAVQTNGKSKAQHRYPRRPVSGGYHDYRMSRESDTLLERTSLNDISGNEATAADVLAGICGALSSEAVSSCVTSSIDPVEGGQKANHMLNDSSYTPDVTQHIIDEDDTCSDKGSANIDIVDWTDEEKSLFIRALSSFGKDFAKISRCLGSRSRDQCKIFFSKARKCLGLDRIHQIVGNGGIPVSDGNGERSDTDDAGVVETGSAICSTQSCSKTDANFTQSVTKACSEECGPPGNHLMQIELHKSRDKNESKAGSLNREEASSLAENRLSGVENCQTGIHLEDLCRDGADMAGTLLSCDFSVQLGLVDGKTKERETDMVASLAESVLPEGSGRLGQSKPQVLTNIQRDVDRTMSADLTKTGSPSPQHLTIETGLHEKRDKQVSIDARICCQLMDLNTSGNTCHAVTDSCFRQIDVNAPDCQQQTSVERSQKLRVFVRKQKDLLTHLPADLVLPDPSSSNRENGINKVVTHPSILNFSGHGNVHLHSSDNSEFHQQHHSQNPSLNQNRADSGLQVFGGYPHHVLNDPVNHDSSANGESKNFNSSGPLHLPAESAPKPESRMQEPNDRLRYSQPQVHSDNEQKSQGSGDVKLFGQILNHPSQPQKSKPACVGKEEASTSPRAGKLVVLKSQNSRVDKPLIHPPVKDEISSQLSLEDLPNSRSYGTWGGNHVQRGGFNSLTESLMLVGGYSRACRLEQDVLEGLMRGNQVSSIPSMVDHHSGNEVLALEYSPSCKALPNGVTIADHHPHMSQQQVQQQLVSLERKRHHELLSGPQKRGLGLMGYQASNNRSVIHSEGLRHCRILWWP
ncbi:hypothetical protein QJS10_CPB21g01217 [Acorus calamus]|uniref:SANT domain-containing protein n=1 Tax=Acorus calamus TaxID=4465 RepID=A0AAV9C687_ACOCL|nr:hypothetical protein QJS10_CPB21g01217 [Acorus calamus]